MNVLEDSLVKPLPSLDVSAARKRRRQKRLKPLKTPDQLEIVELKDLEKNGASPVYSVSPVSTLDEGQSCSRSGNEFVPLPSGSSSQLQTAVSNFDVEGAVQEVDDHRNDDVSDILQMGSDVDHSREYIEQSTEVNITASTEALEPTVKKVKPKKNKHKKSKNVSKPTEDITSNATTISAALNEIIDAVEVVDEKHPPPKPRRSMSRYSGKGSEISLISDGRVFVQQGRNFTVTPRDKAFCRTGALQDNSSFHQSNTTALTMAMSYQKKFLPLSTMCHGLLAGIAIWQCITVFQENGDSDTALFVERYSKVARIFQSVFYTLATVSCVAVLDRCVPSSFSWQGLWELLVLQPCCLFALLASCGALLSCGIAAKLDDRLALHNVNETLWPDSEMSDEYLSEWLTSNLVRCVLAVVSYLIISLCWGDDNSGALPFPEMSASVKPETSLSA